jgi:DNA-binding transcriptional regulator YdaS (Cro superfamily)
MTSALMRASAPPPAYQWADRPAILEACRSLGINDRRVARLLDITPEQVHAWVAGKRPIPHVRLLALAFVIGRLIGEIAAEIPPQTRYARRAEIAREAASKWCALALLELTEDLGGDITAHRDLIQRGYELGKAALRKLEAQ